MEEMLRADNITFSYTDDQHRAVDGLSLRVKRGEYVAVLGANGCGKSTLGRTILRLTPATERQIHAGQAF